MNAVLPKHPSKEIEATSAPLVRQSAINSGIADNHHVACRLAVPSLLYLLTELYQLLNFVQKLLI